MYIHTVYMHNRQRASHLNHLQLDQKGTPPAGSTVCRHSTRRKDFSQIKQGCKSAIMQVEVMHNAMIPDQESTKCLLNFPCATINVQLMWNFYYASSAHFLGRSHFSVVPLRNTHLCVWFVALPLLLVMTALPFAWCIYSTGYSISKTCKTCILQCNATMYRYRLCSTNA